jgi:hypothetical protein
MAQNLARHGERGAIDTQAVDEILAGLAPKLG